MNQPYPVKTIAIKKCSRCNTDWTTDRAILEPHDQVEFAIIRIAYCPACAEGFAAEIDRPTYNRTGKKIK